METSLIPTFLSDLHQIKSHAEYFTRMNVFATCNGLWGDEFTILWASHFLKMTIYVWSSQNQNISMKCGENYNTLPLHSLFNDAQMHAIHIEPIIAISSLNENNPHSKEYTTIKTIVPHKIEQEVLIIDTTLKTTLLASCMKL